MPGGFVCSASLKAHARHAGVKDDASRGERPLRKLFSKEQRAFFAEHAPEGVELDDLSILGPIFVLKLKFAPEGASAARWSPSCGSTRTARGSSSSRRSALPNEAFQVAAEARAFLVERGVDLSRRAADEDAHGARVLHALNSRERLPAAPRDREERDARAGPTTRCVRSRPTAPSASGAPRAVCDGSCRASTSCSRALTCAPGRPPSSFVTRPAGRSRSAARRWRRSLRRRRARPLQGHAQRAVALVGHEPNLSRLASLLLAGDEGAVSLELKKGGIVLLSFPAAPAPGLGAAPLERRAEAPARARLTPTSRSARRAGRASGPGR